MTTLIKTPRRTGELAKIKGSILAVADQLLKEKELRSVRFIVDVDPV